MSTLDISNDRDREIVNAIGTALQFLGADSMLQSAFNSIWENDHDMALGFLNDWNEHECDRIASVMEQYSKFGVWRPCTEYRRSAHRGCSRRVSLTVKTCDQLVES